MGPFLKKSLLEPSLLCTPPAPAPAQAEGAEDTRFWFKNTPGVQMGLDGSHGAAASPECFEQTKRGSSEDCAGTTRGINTNAALGQLEKREHLLESQTTELGRTGTNWALLWAPGDLLPLRLNGRFRLQAGIIFCWGRVGTGTAEGLGSSGHGASLSRLER